MRMRMSKIILNNLFLKISRVYNDYSICVSPKRKTEMEGRLGKKPLRYKV